MTCPCFDQKTIPNGCHCKPGVDGDLERVIELSNAGLDWLTACQMVWPRLEGMR